MSLPANQLELMQISKSFGKNSALDNVNFTFKSGEIHALLGQNGAGKSTLMKILFGLYQPDSGQILFNRRLIKIQSPRQALERGIAFVQQHFSLVESFTVAENIVLGNLHAALIDQQKIQQDVQEKCDAFQFGLRAGQRVSELSVGQRQRVEIVKALYQHAHFIIFDEPTSVLAPHEVDGLLQRIRSLRDAGIGIVFISHKLNEVLAIADCVTVLRNGKQVFTGKNTGLSAALLAEKMMGTKIEFLQNDGAQTAPKSKKSVPILHIKNLVLFKNHPETTLSFTIGRGEILGIAGVDGSGQQELAEMLFGVRPLHAGSITPGENFSLDDIALLPQDRLRHGVIKEFSLIENLHYPRKNEPFSWQRFLLRAKKLQHYTEQQLAPFQIKYDDVYQPARFLSGGNQQKFLFARLLASEAQLFIVMNPTWGVDVVAAQEIHARIRELVAQGKSVLLVSTELEEIYQLANRFFVLHNGGIMGWGDRQTDVQTVSLWMGGVHQKD